MRTSIRPTVAEIDLGAIVRNRDRVQALVGDSEVWGVIKADAYGHGAVPVARALQAGCTALAVSLVEEGLELRAAGIDRPIVVLGAHYGGCHSEVLHARLTPVIYDPADIDLFAQAARRARRQVDVHFKVDTGMSRLGLIPGDLNAAVDRLEIGGDGGLRLSGLCTHFASADLDGQMTHDALTKFRICVDALMLRKPTLDKPTLREPMLREPTLRAPMPRPLLHAANSAAAIRHPATRLDAVRPGLVLYGATPAPSVELAGLEPALRLTTRVMSIRDLAPGTGVSYGALWVASRPSRIATLPVGYADGYPRHVRAAQVLIRGQRCPVIGAVCMDMMMVDVTDIEGGAFVGDRVTLIGTDAAHTISVDELARAAGTISYEVLCGISKRVPRVYKGTS